MTSTGTLQKRMPARSRRQLHIPPIVMLHKQSESKHLSQMKRFLVLITVSFSLQLYSQEIVMFDSIKKITLEFNIDRLPDGLGGSEKYILRKHLYRHICVDEKRIFNIDFKTRRLFKKGNKRLTIEGINHYLLCSQSISYNIPLKNLDLNKIYLKAKEEKQLNVNSDILHQYLDSDTLKIFISEFNTEYSKTRDNHVPMGLDGSPFRMLLKIYKSSGETEQFTFAGNIWDELKDRDVANFLLAYELYTKYEILACQHDIGFFLNENMENLILRYIAYRENTFDKEIEIKRLNKLK
jgi:hypothetical protein